MPNFARLYRTPLSDAMDEHRISDRALAERTGLSHNMIRYYQAGYRQMPFMHARQIAIALDVPIESLLFNHKDYRPQNVR